MPHKKSKGKDREDEDADRTHRTRALALNVLFVALSAVFIALLVVMVVWGPEVVLEEKDLKGEYYGTFETDTETITIEATPEIPPGNTMDWEITAGPENETIHSGSQEEDDPAEVIVDLDGPGEYGIHIVPPYAGPVNEYSLTVMEHKVHPTIVKAVRMLSMLVLGAVLLVLGLYVMSKRRRHLPEYRWTLYVTGPMCCVTALLVIAVTW